LLRWYSEIVLTLTITEVRRRFSELIKRANGGERIVITRRGKLVAILAPPQPEHCLKEIFAGMEKIRERSRLPKGVTIKSLIEEGRK
jgi:prevent-host-death family protein